MDCVVAWMPREETESGRMKGNEYTLQMVLKVLLLLFFLITNL